MSESESIRPWERPEQPELHIVSGMENLLNLHDDGERREHFWGISGIGAIDLREVCETPASELLIHEPEMAARMLWEFYDTLGPLTWEFPEFVNWRGTLMESAYFERPNHSLITFAKQDNVSFKHAFACRAQERCEENRYYTEVQHLQAYENARRGGLAAVEADLSQKLASIECVRASQDVWLRAEGVGERWDDEEPWPLVASLREEMTTLVAAVEASPAQKLCKRSLPTLGGILGDLVRDINNDAGFRDVRFPLPCGPGRRWIHPGGVFPFAEKYRPDEEIFRRHFTRVARSGMRGFVEDPGPRDKALLLARRQWEYTYLLRYFFEGRQDFAGPDGNVLPCVGADSFLYTFVEMLLAHFRSFDVTPMAYAQRMDEEYAMARRKGTDSIILQKKELAIDLLRKYANAWDAAEILLRRRKSFLLCLQRCRQQPRVRVEPPGPPTTFFGRLIARARVKRARTYESDDFSKLANAPPDIVRNMAEYI